MNKTISTNIIVLKKLPYQESSLIISSISAEYGKIDFVVKGARKITKKEQPIVDIFRELSVEYRESKNGLNTPLSLDLLKEYDKIALHPDIFIGISQIALFLRKNSYPHVPCNRVYSAFKLLLEKSTDGSIDAFDLTLLKLVFLHENGLLPEHFETTIDSLHQLTAEEMQQRKFLNRLILYAEGKKQNIPKLSPEYKNKFSSWVTNLCCYNGLE